MLAKIMHSWCVESEKWVEICFHHWISEITQKWHFWKKIKQSRYMSGNWFRLFRVVNAVKLYHCFGHWLCKKLELRSVGLLLNNQLCWAEICLWKFCCRLHLLPVLLSVVLILLSLLLLLSEAAASRKLCWVNMWYWLPFIKVAQFSF